MEAMRKGWTDGRLDDLSHRMDEGFRRVDADLREIRTEMGSMRTEMNGRFDALQRTLIQIGGGMAVAFGAALIGLIATQL